MRTCSNCQNTVQDDAIFCDQCGTRLPAKEAQPAAAPQTESVQPAVQPEPVAASEQPTAVPAAAPAEPQAAPAAVVSEAICPSCGAQNLPGEAFCQNCGTPLAAPEPVTSAQIPVVAPEAASAVVADPHTCRDCGAGVKDDDEFCFACGSDLKNQRGLAPVQSQAAPVDAAAPAVGGLNCPSCGAQVTAQDVYCENCGTALKGAGATAAVEPTPAVSQAAAAASEACLVVSASGTELPLPAVAEVVVGREDAYSGVFPEIDLTAHGGVDGGVSRKHFKISSSGGSYTIEDLNSTNFTLLNRQRLQPGTPQPLKSGDEIDAGRVKLIFKVGA
ncbi:MAG: zinc-ribbon domain-containing protein [Chloroflexi bacterium]|nr:zinc-ribbon domain-containing protein [Chloroflexota bacterium]